MSSNMAGTSLIEMYFYSFEHPKKNILKLNGGFSIAMFDCPKALVLVITLQPQ